MPIGRPIANTQIYMLDGQGEPVPVGVAGELYIGGAGVARGYLNRAGADGGAVRAGSVRGESRERGCTGRGIWGGSCADGNIEFLGRNDHQVKIRGFRIELGEIEARLAEHAGVREAVVVAREDERGRQAAGGVLHVRGRRGAAWSARRCATHLAADAAGVHGAGGVRAAGGAAADAERQAGSEGAAGAGRRTRMRRGATRRRRARSRRRWRRSGRRCWSVERVGRHDNFFELGGHSLLAVTLIERMRRAGLQVDVRALFATPTLAELAAAVGARRARRGGAAEPDSGGLRARSRRRCCRWCS